ncbi:hypothetical protein HDU97_006211 [Phlyctochytrium planicorne]|nr:hypothetical protein HDU97_006211 [Phlyctochytrium planicorne]
MTEPSVITQDSTLRHRNPTTIDGNDDPVPLPAAYDNNPPSPPSSTADSKDTTNQHTEPKTSSPPPQDQSSTYPNTTNAPPPYTAPAPTPPTSPQKDTNAPTGPSTSTAPPPLPDGAPQDEKMCRICFGGVEDEETLGRLISPCRCKGSMKHVHIIIVTLLTVIAFLMTVFVAGFIAKFLIVYVLYDPTDELLMEPTPPPLDPLTGNPIAPASTTAQSDDQDLIDMLLSHLSPDRIRLLSIDITHMLSGIVLVGVVGCFSMLYYLVVNPMGFHMNFGGTRRGGRGDNVSAAVVMIFIVIGVVRMGYSIWQTVRRVCRTSLKLVEDRILDVEEAELEAAGVRPQDIVG